MLNGDGGHTVNIRLTDEQAAIVKHRVRCGKNQSEEEVLDDALQGLIGDEIIDGYDLDELCASLRQSREQLRRGEGRTWDLQEFLQAARACRSKRRDQDHA